MKTLLCLLLSCAALLAATQDDTARAFLTAVSTNNFSSTNIVQLAATNSTANTNITIDYSLAIVSLHLTNNASFTNTANAPTNSSASVVYIITPEVVNRTIVWPTLGAPSFGRFWRTNANAPMLTTLIVGNVYALSITPYETNDLVSLTRW